ncbi:MAG: undecaprenyldiphospho-muramoylpentapeptide beta-N-acetylglucosaminyltransferase [bacterium]|nr:undecaprenyldiphospho-muramoylpentapeptide beta-N-acetylglucosaminyltransferase [bacterium]
MRQDNKKLNVVLTGGGTGGHIYPAIAVGRELLTRDDVEKVYYIGNPEKLEKTITEKEDFEFLPVKVSGLPKKKDFALVKCLFELGVSVIKCLGYFKKIHPDCILGTGGYVSAPALIAAKITGIPYMLHDSDAIPGIVSRKMSSSAKAMNISFEEAKKYLKAKNIGVNGNPLRSEFNALDKKVSLKSLNLSPDKFTILVMGGSQGAKSINAAIAACAQELIEELNIQIIHQTGLKNYEEYMDGISSELRNNPSYLPKAYLDNMPMYLSCADLVIARAGSLSLSEFNLSGLPSILVPYPHAANNHQYHNAMALEKAGAAVCLEDNLCDGDNLREIVNNLVNDKERLQSMKEANLKLAKPDATKKITDILVSIAK